MKLAHYDFDNVFDIVPEKVNILIIEPEDRFFD